MVTKTKEEVWVKIFAEFNSAFEALKEIQFTQLEPVIADLKAPVIDKYWTFNDNSIGSVGNAVESFRKISEKMAELLSEMQEKMRDFTDKKCSDIEFECKYWFRPELEEDD